MSIQNTWFLRKIFLIHYFYGKLDGWFKGIDLNKFVDDMQGYTFIGLRTFCICWCDLSRGALPLDVSKCSIDCSDVGFQLFPMTYQCFMMINPWDLEEWQNRDSQIRNQLYAMERNDPEDLEPATDQSWWKSGPKSYKVGGWGEGELRIDKV